MRRLNNKSGEMTLWKLISIILVILLIVVVGIGWSAGMINPIKIVQNFANYVKGLFSSGDKENDAFVKTVNLPKTGYNNVKLSIFGDEFGYCQIDYDPNQDPEATEEQKKAGSWAYRLSKQGGKDWIFEKWLAIENSEGWLTGRNWLIDPAWKEIWTASIKDYENYERGLFQAIVRKFGVPYDKNKIEKSDVEGFQDNGRAYIKYYYGDLTDYYYLPMWVSSYGLTVKTDWGGGTYFALGGFSAVCLIEIKKDVELNSFEELNLMTEKGGSTSVYERIECDDDVMEDKKTGRYQLYAAFKRALASTYANHFTYNGAEYVAENNWKPSSVYQGKIVYRRHGEVSPSFKIVPAWKNPGSVYGIRANKHARDGYYFYISKDDGNTWNVLEEEYLYIGDKNVEKMAELRKMREDLKDACRGEGLGVE